MSTLLQNLVKKLKYRFRVRRGVVYWAAEWGKIVCLPHSLSLPLSLPPPPAVAGAPLVSSGDWPGPLA